LSRKYLRSGCIDFLNNNSLTYLSPLERHCRSLDMRFTKGFSVCERMILCSLSRVMICVSFVQLLIFLLFYLGELYRSAQDIRASILACSAQGQRIASLYGWIKEHILYSICLSDATCCADCQASCS